MNQFSTDIRQGTFKKHSGMYIGEEMQPEIKENRNILITTYPDQTTAYQHQIGTYQRNSKNHKKGDIKYQTRYKNWICIYSNILKAWENVCTYPTVSYGLTCDQRNAFVVDVDEYFESLEIAEKYILSIRNIRPSYIIRNPKSGHIQFGYAIKQPIKKWLFPQYNQLIKKLAGIFHSDACFNGPACKNPYYVGFESKISGIVYDIKDLKGLFSVLSNEEESDKQILLQQSVAMSSKELRNSNNKENNKENNNLVNNNKFLLFPFLTHNTNTNLNKDANLINEDIQENEVNEVNSLQQIADADDRRSDVSSDNNGWHNTFLKIGRNLVFKYFREHKEKFPNELIDSTAEEVSILTEQTTGIAYTDKKESILQMRSIVKWCNDKGWKSFGNIENKGKTIKDTANCTAFGSNTRRKSLETRHNRKLEKIVKFREWMEIHYNEVDLESKGKPKKGKISRRKAAELIGISYDEFRAYLKMLNLGEISIEIREENKYERSSEQDTNEDIWYNECDTKSMGGVQGQLRQGSASLSRKLDSEGNEIDKEQSWQGHESSLSQIREAS